MSPSFNPAEWAKAFQSILTQEKSSGFRPFIVFIIIVTMACLMLQFAPYEGTRTFSLWALGVSWVGFLSLFSIKAFSDPDFCRSEKHIERIRQIELGDSKMKGPYLPGALLQIEPEKNLLDHPESSQEGSR